jgi:hypothetical protein
MTTTTATTYRSDLRNRCFKQLGTGVERKEVVEQGNVVDDEDDDEEDDGDG